MFTKHTGKPAPAVNIAQVFAATEAARKTAIRSPMLSHPLAVTYITITVLIMCYSWRFNVWPILLFLGIWGSVLVFKGFELLKPSREMLVCLSMPILCIVSTGWSTAAGTTLYLGAAFIALNVCTLIISRSIAFRSLIYGLVLGTLIALLLSVYNGHKTLDHLTGTYDLAGLFGSKNTVGLVAEIGILSTASLLLMPGTIANKIIFAAVPCTFFSYCLIQSHSGTSLVSLLIAAFTGMIVLIASKLPSSVRWSAILFAVPLLTIGSLSLLSFGGKELLLKSLGKDTTLTGRTELWEAGKKIASEKPLLGNGYSAFWLKGQPQAEMLWAKFNINARAGFHFHSTYVQTLVDLGLTGLILISLLITTNILASLRLCLRYGAPLEILFMLILAVMFAVRSWVEIDFFLGPFGPGTLLFYLIFPRVCFYTKAHAQTRE